MSLQHVDIPPSEWGATVASSFITKSHHEPYTAIDPSRARLPKPFVVCIVGASRGIGAGTVCSYAKAGATGLVLASRRVSGLEETAAKCKALQPDVETEIVACDITSNDSVAALAQTTKDKFSRLDVVVVNSGYSGPVVLSLTETDPVTFQQAIKVNYVGTFHCAKHLIPLLLETDRGAKAFIVVSSLAAVIIRGAIANTQYCVSKLAQLKLIEHVHEQYSAQGLQSFSVHPGAVATEMAEETAPGMFKSALVDSPELCGAFCVWLTKEGNGSSWLSGRLCSANWDVDELEGRRGEVVKGDLLKIRLDV
ncbi:uncharacterized protein LTR77_006767 [Saxophila tyrrhenica]|uniref:NAD(P)-binding protein n=1 Tax=Saxophila tyrrhenica TaxID=1690608 RepID=A0AAV9P688_9PEZI|nr:hypothetical protein LTR77_006767 [Saxophila tyrrhenica]